MPARGARRHVHDLRHTGKPLAAEAGASLAELMSRMGHSSTRAARVYLHAREERDQQLAAALDKMGPAGAETVSQHPEYEPIGHVTGTRASQKVTVRHE